MNDLVEFLRARIAEDEQAARDTAYSLASSIEDSWSVRQKDRRDDMSWAVYSQGKYLKGNDLHEADARHIARHDPARVLRHINAQRRRLARHAPTEDPLHGTLCSQCSIVQVSVYQTWPCPDVRDDAAVYANHPEYRAEWRP